MQLLLWHVSSQLLPELLNRREAIITADAHCTLNNHSYRPRYICYDQIGRFEWVETLTSGGAGDGIGGSITGQQRVYRCSESIDICTQCRSTAILFQRRIAG